MEDVQSMNLWQKLSCIRKMAAVVKKSANAYNYVYSPEDAVLAQVTAGMNKYGVSLKVEVPEYDVIPRSYKKTKKDKANGVIEEEINVWLVKGVIKYTWVDDANPTDRIVALWPLLNEKDDVAQAFGGAMTYCQRYFLLKYFQTATTKDDPDNYLSRQKEAQEKERVATAKAVISEVNTIVNDFVSGNTTHRDNIIKIIKKHVRVNGKPSADYSNVTDPDVATALQNDILDYITKHKENSSNE